MTDQEPRHNMPPERKIGRSKEFIDEYTRLYASLRVKCDDLKNLNHNLPVAVWNSEIAQIEDKIERAVKALKEDVHRSEETYVHIVIDNINLLRSKIGLDPIKRNELY